MFCFFSGRNKKNDLICRLLQILLGVLSDNLISVHVIRLLRIRYVKDDDYATRHVDVEIFAMPLSYDFAQLS